MFNRRDVLESVIRPSDSSSSRCLVNPRPLHLFILDPRRDRAEWQEAIDLARLRFAPEMTIRTSYLRDLFEGDDWEDRVFLGFSESGFDDWGGRSLVIERCTKLLAGKKIDDWFFVRVFAANVLMRLFENASRDSIGDANQRWVGVVPGDTPLELSLGDWFMANNCADLDYGHQLQVCWGGASCKCHFAEDARRRPTDLAINSVRVIAENLILRLAEIGRHYMREQTLGLTNPPNNLHIWV